MKIVRRNSPLKGYADKILAHHEGTIADSGNPRMKGDLCNVREAEGVFTDGGNPCGE
jgi:hypothetical protein